MKVINIVLSGLFVFSLPCSAQRIDVVRLAYAEREVNAEQVAMAATPDGRFIGFVYKDNVIKILDVNSGKTAKLFKGPYSDVLDFFLTGGGVAVLIRKNEVVLIDWKKEETLLKLALADDAKKAAYSGASDILAIGQQGGYVSLIDVTNRKLSHELQVKRHHVSGLAFHPDGNSIVVAVVAAMNFTPSSLTLFDVKSGEQKAVSTEQAYFTMVAFSEDGSEILAAGMNKNATKRVMVSLHGQTLNTQHQYAPESTMSTTKTLYGGTIYGKKLLGITYSHSFNVYDAMNAGMEFTTESERGGLPPFILWGVGSYNVFPLGSSSGKVILNAAKNNINQIYDVKTNSIVGYVFSDSNDDFAVVSRDGRVEGTEGALSKLYWTSRKSAKRTSLESTFEKGFTPKLLASIILENANDVAFEIDDVISKIPVIGLKSVNGTATRDLNNLQSTQKSSELEIVAAENAGEITEVKLFHNNKLIQTSRNTGSAVFRFNLTLNNAYGENNFFYATASSKSGIDSEKLKFVISYKGATTEQPNLYLITIGINEYKNKKYNLNYALADADAIDEAIRKGSASLFKNVYNFQLRNTGALKTDILAAFDQVKQKAMEQDVLIVYYAGHGVMSEQSADQNREFFLIPHDITQLYGRDDMLFEKALSAEEIKSIAKTINAQKQVFILDACQSAGALENAASRGVLEEKAIAQMARSTGTFWIAASGSEQFATEFEELKHGIFTYALLEGLGGKADANADHKLTVRELSTYIEQIVPELSERFKGASQFPSAYSFGNDFPIIVYK
jgi:WD40 repeat protein